MLRTLFAVIAGFFAAEMVITVIEAASATWLFPPPPGFDFRNKAAVDAFVASMPASAFATVLSGWLLGTFVGAFVAARLALVHRTRAALLIGLVVVVGTIVNATEIRHPAWVVALGALLPLPLAWLAARLAQKGLANTR